MFRPTHKDKQSIKKMGRTMLALPSGNKVAVCVDRGIGYEGKADWYVEQFKKKYPALNAIYIGPYSDSVDIIHIFSPAVSQN